jgi:hypothetical protein
MKGLILSFFICAAFYSKAQNPLVKMWDYRYGGTTQEDLFSIVQTNDKGFIIGGRSCSGVSGNKSATNCSQVGDYWIVKLDSLGNQIWDRDFGGDNHDFLIEIEQVFDAGYILAGWSLSDLSCDKTQPLWGTAYNDFWVVKIDSIGNKVWDKRFGGNQMDYLIGIEQTADSGYVLGGYGFAVAGGDRTQPIIGLFDFWIVKIDQFGNKIWDKIFGGTSNEWLYSVHQTLDGGYILGGTSSSGISGDKSEANFDTLGNSTDYWILKINSAGNKMWDRTFGGTDSDYLYNVAETPVGEYIISGHSYSPISGNKSIANWGSTYSSDLWIIKTDSVGNKLWDKCYGGFSDEEAYPGSFSLTHDGGMLLSTNSYSQTGGDKTENNFGSEQTWVVKLDSAGNKIWDKTLLTGGHDEDAWAIQVDSSCYLMGNSTYADIGGDKSVPNWGFGNTGDYWLIKFCETISSNFSAMQFTCPGSCIDFINLSTSGTTFKWSFPGAAPDTSTVTNPTNICYPNPGTYDVQLIATNANGSDTLLLSNYITVYPSPSPQSISQSGDTLFAIAGSAAYQWYYNGNVINGATDYFYVASSSGDYNVIASDSNGCEVEAAIFNVIADLPSTVDRGLLTVFPNPVGETLNVISHSLTGTAMEISIYNVLGEMAMAVSVPVANCDADGGWQNCILDVSGLPAGIFLVEVSSAEKLFRTPFLKQ